MTESGTGRATLGSAPRRTALARREDAWLTAGILFVLALQFSEIFARGVNWDEFAHYNQLWELRRGALGEAVNTGYTRVLVWVTHLPGDAIDHVILIRLIMFGFELAIIVGIAGLAMRFADRTTALLCALAYAAFPFVFEHGYSYRFDPPAAALTVAAAWLLVSRRPDRRTILGLAVLIGLALLVTIKIVLLLPAFAGLLWLRWSERGFARDFALRIAVAGSLAVALAGLLFLAHAATLPGEPAETSGAMAGRVGSIMFALEPKPYWPVVALAARQAPFVALVVVLFPFMLRGSEHSPAEKIALAALYSTIATLVYYHNTAPYFYVFMLPFVLVACCIPMRAVAGRLGTGLIALVLVLGAVLTYALEAPSPLWKQRQIIAAAQEAFPAGTAYFDLMGMLPRFPKANGFMTPLNIRRQHAAGRSIYSEAMAAGPVPLLLSNSADFEALLDERLPPPAFPDGQAIFTPEDAEAIRDTYLPFWGPFLLAGERIPAGTAPHRFEVRVPGPYTVTGTAITLDGQRLFDGAIVELDRGAYEVAGERAGEARLTWGRDLARPAGPAPAEPIMPAW